MLDFPKTAYAAPKAFATIQSQGSGYAEAMGRLRRPARPGNTAMPPNRTLPDLPPRTLAALLAVACLLSFGAAGVVAVDLQAGLGAGTFHLVRQPVSRDAGGLFTAVAVME